MRKRRTTKERLTRAYKWRLVTADYTYTWSDYQLNRMRIKYEKHVLMEMGIGLRSGARFKWFKIGGYEIPVLYRNKSAQSKIYNHNHKLEKSQNHEPG